MLGSLLSVEAVTKFHSLLYRPQWKILEDVETVDRVPPSLPVLRFEGGGHDDTAVGGGEMWWLRREETGWHLALETFLSFCRQTQTGERERAS
jgi:hypothetical protein